MIPEDKTLCLAHEHDRLPRKPGVPPDFCDRLVDCARHQAIGQTPHDGSHFIKQRVCQAGKHDAFVPIENQPVEDDSLAETERGDGGFGSTGSN